MANHHQDKHGRVPARPDVQLVPQSENRLRRETPYVCNVRFHADLPEVPCDPKMLIAPLQPEKLAQFSLTSLERNPRRDLVLEADLGIHISLLDIQRYSVPDNALPLAPEDAALLADDTNVVVPTAVAATAKARERARGARAEVSWLMRTTYISNEVLERRSQAAPDKRARADPDGLNQADLDEREAHLAHVEESFEAMHRTPVHGRNPELTPLAVLPVLPDEERVAHNYVLATFDSDPTADHPRLARFSASQRLQFAERAAAKSYSLRRQQDGGQDQFVAYLLPMEPPRGADEAGPSREADEVAYEWVREYSYKVKQEENVEDRQPTFWFLFSGDRVTYCDLSTRLELRKRARRKEGESEFQRPSQILLKRLPPEAPEDRPAKRARNAHDEEEPAHTPPMGTERALQAEADAPTWLPNSEYSD